MVIINRNNYEEFFLLHVDNELDEVQRKELDKFLSENPDLAKELEMLQQATLINDYDVKFEAKDILYKKEAGISLSNYEEYFLLFIDNELSEEENAQVEKFVLQHPQLQTEFTLLQRSKLQAETVEFAGKELLYRAEKKERRVIPVLWARMGVAAAVLAIISALWIFNQNNDTVNSNDLSILKNAKSSSQPFNVTEDNKVVTEQRIASLHKEERNTGGKEVGANKYVVKEVIKSTSRKRKQVTNVKQRFISTEPVQQEFIAQTQKPIEEKVYSPAEGSTKGLKTANNAVSTLVAVKNTESHKSLVNQTIYRELDNSDDDKTILIGGAEINKNKLKGIFKKAVNFLEKRAVRKTDEKTIQIASFELRG